MRTTHRTSRILSAFRSAIILAMLLALYACEEDSPPLAADEEELACELCRFSECIAEDPSLAGQVISLPETTLTFGAPPISRTAAAFVGTVTPEAALSCLKSVIEAQRLHVVPVLPSSCEGWGEIVEACVIHEGESCEEKRLSIKQDAVPDVLTLLESGRLLPILYHEAVHLPQDPDMWCSSLLAVEAYDNHGRFGETLWDVLDQMLYFTDDAPQCRSLDSIPTPSTCLRDYVISVFGIEDTSAEPPAEVCADIDAFTAAINSQWQGAYTSRNLARFSAAGDSACEVVGMRGDPLTVTPDGCRSAPEHSALLMRGAPC